MTTRVNYLDELGVQGLLWPVASTMSDDSAVACGQDCCGLWPGLMSDESDDSAVLGC